MIAKSPAAALAMTSLIALTLPWLLSLFHLVGPVPLDLGLQGSQLRPCTSPAHCAERVWSVEDTAIAMAVLKQALLVSPRTTVITDDPERSYLHATASTPLMGFVDDVELHVDQINSRIEARSESRLGESDLGLNGQRLTALERALKDARMPARP